MAVTVNKRPGRPSATAADRIIGNLIRTRRVQMGLTQTVLGDMLGLTFQQIQKYERGLNRISASRLGQVAAALDMPVTLFYEAGHEGLAPVADSAAPALRRNPEEHRLMRAFGQIRSRRVRQCLLALVEQAALSDPGRGRTGESAPGEPKVVRSGQRSWASDHVSKPSGRRRGGSA